MSKDNKGVCTHPPLLFTFFKEKSSADSGLRPWPERILFLHSPHIKPLLFKKFSRFSGSLLNSSNYGNRHFFVACHRSILSALSPVSFYTSFWRSQFWPSALCFLSKPYWTSCAPLRSLQGQNVFFCQDNSYSEMSQTYDRMQKQSSPFHLFPLRASRWWLCLSDNR